MDILGKIRQKSREQWVDQFKGYLDDVRIWIEDNGIKASASALVVGMAFILFFKLFITLIVLSALTAFFIWSVAIPEGQPVAKKESKPDVSVNGHSRKPDDVEITPKKN